jgi:hypothetical protein
VTVEVVMHMLTGAGVETHRPIGGEFPRRAPSRHADRSVGRTRVPA